MAVTIQFKNIGEFEKALKALHKENVEPLNKEFAYLIKQYSDAHQLVPRLTGNLQETATPLDAQSAQWDGKYAYITYPTVYATRLWFGVHFHFTRTENFQARAKWLVPVFKNTWWVNRTLKYLFHKHITDKGSRAYGKFLKAERENE